MKSPNFTSRPHNAGEWEAFPELFLTEVWNDQQVPRWGDRKNFPYETTVIAGKLLLPADVQRLHQFMLDSKTVKAITDEMRLAVEALWPELAYKLPPNEVV